MDIKVEVRNLGKAAGTLGWVKQRIETAKVVIEPENDGILAGFIVYSHPESKKEIKRKVAKMILTENARSQAEEFKGYGYQRFDGECEYAFASDAEWAQFGEKRWSVFGVRLTDAATKIVSAFIAEVVAALKAAQEEN